jgi:hypothetical protein
MSYPVHHVFAGDVLPIYFSTYGKTNGESLTMSGLAVTDIEIYKDGSTTQRASDAGYTLLDTDGIDFDGLTGIHGFSIDTGDNTDAGFYTVGSWFHVVVSSVTVDSQTVNFIAAAFRLLPAESVAGKPKVDVDAFGGSAGTFASGIPEVKVASLANNAITAASINADAITAAKVAADVTTEIQNGLATAAALTTVEGKIDTIDNYIDDEIGLIDTAVDAILALLDDARTEPGQGAPPVNPDLATKVDYIYKFLRNKVTQTADTMTVYADDGTTADHKSTVSDDGTTYTRGEFISGA